jgi:aerobic C4-dicarboxylate transport protein
MEDLGIRKSMTALVLPTGFSFNMIGTSIYLAMASVFITQATDTPMSFMQYLTLLGVLMLTSKGARGVTGSGFIVLAATLSSVDLVPAAGLALMFSVDRFMSLGRALTNLVGNAVAAVIIAKWTGDLDTQKMQTCFKDYDVKFCDA